MVEGIIRQAERGPTKAFITPKIAEFLLAKRPVGQRTIKKVHIAAIADDIRNGRWDDGICNPIRLSRDGQLFDGQHRMAAIVAAGTGVNLWVEVRDSFRHIGDGRARSNADTLMMSGYSNSTKLASVIRAHSAANLAYERDVEYGTAMRSTQPSSAFVVEFARNRPDLEPSIFSVVNMQKRRSVMGGHSPFTVAFASAFLLLATDETGTRIPQESWLRDVWSDVGHENGHSALAYRRWAMSIDSTGRRDYELPNLIRCWNQHARGETVMKCAGVRVTKLERILPARTRVLASV